MTGSIYLPDILPARRCQRGSKKVKSMLLRILGCMREAELKADRTTAATLGLIL